jgi:hypothetical protein
MKPRTKKESRLRERFDHPHDVWMNKDEALRIARRRWKRHRSKYLRRLNASDD